MMFDGFTPQDIVFTGLIFIWAGFVRSGLGFGGAALGLPLMLFIFDKPIYWLPIIGWHLLFFSALTLRTRIHHVNWTYLKRSFIFVIPSALIGVFGLLNLPNAWLVIFVYAVTMFYGFLWLGKIKLNSNNQWLDGFFLVMGGYVAGTSLSGAPLMVAVFMRNVSAAQLRNTLFVLWFILVTIKMCTFAAFNVELHFTTALVLLPIAAIGHIIGLKTHDLILENDEVFKRVIGAILITICFLGFWKIYTKNI